MKEESQEAMELFPQLPIFYLFNGIALIQSENYDDAIDILNSGKNLVVDDNQILAQFYSSLGDAYHSTEEHPQSDNAYEMALKLEPNNVIVLNNYAYYLSIRGMELNKAESMAKKANDLSPNVASFQDTYGWVLYKKQNYQNALFWINEAIKNGGGEDPVVYEHLGDVQLKLNNIEEAVEAWKKALKFGGDPDVLNMKIKQNSVLEE
jgi:Tfp pilus assembly protein PilF